MRFQQETLRVKQGLGFEKGAARFHQESTEKIGIEQTTGFGKCLMA